MQSSVAITLLTSLQLALPILACVAAGIYAAVQSKRHPTASRYLLIAIFIMAVIRILSFLTPILLANSLPPARLGILIYSLNAGWSVLNLVAFGFLIAAIYSKRIPEFQASVPADTVTDMPPGMSPDPSRNPYESPR